MLRKFFNYLTWQLRRTWAWVDWKNRKYHADSVRFQELMAANNEQVFVQMYSDAELLKHYLVDSRINFYQAVAEKVISSFKGDKANASCVDVGCGTGHLLAELRKRGFAGRLVGVDSATTASECVHAHKMGFEFHPGYLSSQTWAREFDLVLCTEVLEHCEHPAQIIHDMFAVVRPGGVIVITVPDGRKDTWEGHIHFWSPESFRLFIESFGRDAHFDYFDNTNYCAIQC